VGEEDGPAVLDEFVEVNVAMGCLGLEVGGLETLATQHHLDTVIAFTN
jgi:hypothetical protein